IAIGLCKHPILLLSVDASIRLAIDRLNTSLFLLRHAFQIHPPSGSLALRPVPAVLCKRG
ncbi:hypothetical protein SK128_007843, partial [Halocaridina rubra]